jgi:hypothetical protein
MENHHFYKWENSLDLPKHLVPKFFGNSERSRVQLMHPWMQVIIAGFSIPISVSYKVILGGLKPPTLFGHIPICCVQTHQLG